MAALPVPVPAPVSRGSVVKDKPTRGSVFSPIALLGFILFCCLLGWGVATHSRALGVGLMIVYAGWLIVGSGAVVWRWWKRRQPE
ncbi:hypothetical protein ISN76_19920 [Dyella halodurans]|uniref:Uncharacterized protein n=1 Tax=Dyella halodurans TaxID=1920171 RepID=A0ABV9BZK9_9GAMM|nr:hypothetical protein [Dyella halodurans]